VSNYRLGPVSPQERDLDQLPTAFWSVPCAEMLQQLKSTAEGLPGREAQRRVALYGCNLLTPKKRSDSVTLLLSQFKSPIILILLFATGLSFFPHDPVNALTILANAGLLEFQLLPVSFLLMLGTILLIYIFSAELLKKAFYATVKL
jgi:magnesium-transporting ATPase (P-type)